MSVLNELRELMPERALTNSEARSVAERQAARFLQLSGMGDPHVPGSIIAELPRVDVAVRSGIPVSGATHWDRRSKVWRIELRAQDVPVRQRFSLAHEFKHVIDHPFIDVAYPTFGMYASRQRAEHVCDYFAACLLMPRPWLKRAWASGVQQLELLADLFGVSTQAMAHRLNDIGLVESARCQTYFRERPTEPIVPFAQRDYFRDLALAV
jgi:predicted transcriptional regulator